MHFANDAASRLAFAGVETSIGDIVFRQPQCIEALLASQRSGVPRALALPDDLADVLAAVHVGPDVADMQGHSAVGKHFTGPRPRRSLSHRTPTLLN